MASKSEKIKSLIGSKNYQRLRDSYIGYLNGKAKCRRTINRGTGIAKNAIIRKSLKPKSIASANQSKGEKEREKPHLLLMIYKYNSGNPSFGLSTESNNVTGTLKACGLATFEEFYYDCDYNKFYRDDSLLIDRCIQEKPDAVILSSYSPDNPNQPSLETIKIIREVLGIPVISIWWDSISMNFNRFPCKPTVENSDLNIVIESSISFFDSPHRSKFVQLWAAQDPEIFFDDFRERDLDVSFIGSVTNYRSNRMEYMSYLDQQDINLYFGRGKEKPLTYMEYADIFRRSKMSINFSASTSIHHQIKGRVFEVMLCGSLLLETENNETNKFFTPMVDYIPFSSKEDLLDKVHYFLEHEEERKQIASNGYNKALEQYNCARFWERVLYDHLPEIQKQKNLS